MDNVTLLGTKGEWGGDLLLTLFHREKQDRSTSCVTRAHLKKDPSAAAPLQCWSMCRQISHASVSRNTFKKVHNIRHNEFSALHPYCKKKTPFLEEISLKSKNLVTKETKHLSALCVDWQDIPYMVAKYFTICRFRIIINSPQKHECKKTDNLCITMPKPANGRQGQVTIFGSTFSCHS